MNVIFNLDLPVNSVCNAIHFMAFCVFHRYRFFPWIHGASQWIIVFLSHKNDWKQLQLFSLKQKMWTFSALKYRASILIVHYFYSWMNNFIGLCNRLNKCSYFICLLLTFWASLTLALTTTLVIVLYYSTI